MTEERFTEPDETHDEWVDVRMTDPEEGEWDVDVVVVEGTVEYVDLRIQPDRLADFVECLADDVGEKRVERLLVELAERTSADVDAGTEGDTGATDDGE